MILRFNISNANDRNNLKKIRNKILLDLKGNDLLFDVVSNSVCFQKNARLGGVGMKIFISVDMEGISGIVDSSQTNRDHKEFEKARALMAADVNAAIEGILELGEAGIVVSDGHGSMINIEPEH